MSKKNFNFLAFLATLLVTLVGFAGISSTFADDTDTGSTDTASGSTDTGSTDTGSTDTGSTDTGSTDTGSTDTGSTDTGSTDTGSTDTGSTDTGSTDTGSTDTATGIVNTGVTDSGSTDSVVKFDVVVESGSTIDKVEWAFDNSTGSTNTLTGTTLTLTGDLVGSGYSFDVTKTENIQKFTVKVTVKDENGAEISLEYKGEIPAIDKTPTSLEELKKEAINTINGLNLCQKKKNEYIAKVNAVQENEFSKEEIEKITNAIKTFVDEEDLDKLFSDESVAALTGALEGTGFTDIVKNVEDIAKEYNDFTGSINTGAIELYTGALKDYTGALDDFSGALDKIFKDETLTGTNLTGNIDDLTGSIDKLNEAADKLEVAVGKLANAGTGELEEAANGYITAAKDFSTASTTFVNAFKKFSDEAGLTSEHFNTLLEHAKKLSEAGKKLNEAAIKIINIKPADFDEKVTKLKNALKEISKNVSSTAKEQIEALVSAAQNDKCENSGGGSGGGGKSFDNLYTNTGSTATGSTATGTTDTGSTDTVTGSTVTPDNKDVTDKPTNEKGYCYENVDFDFSDINKTFAKEYLKTLAGYGIITGYRDGKIHANRNTTRAEFLKIIFKAMCIDYSDADVSTLKYSDVKKKSWEAKVIAKAVELGVVTDKKRKFRPTDNVSRIETLRIIFNAAGIDVSSDSKTSENFSDVKGWGAKYVDTALDMGIISGNKKFRPNSSITRAETSKIVVNSIVESDDLVETSGESTPSKDDTSDSLDDLLDLGD